mgnify:CR=1 FL=1
MKAAARQRFASHYSASLRFGVYIHVPLCLRRCAYCDFTSYVVSSRKRKRVAAGLLDELKLHPGARGRTLFIGGGTPNLLGMGDLGQLVARARDRFSLPIGAEVSVESNPGANAGIGYFEALLRAGLTRLSVGFQSFDDEELKILGRLHRSSDTDIFKNARRAGLRSISLDLLYGLPGQRPDTVRRSLETALSLGVDHVSLYALKLEPSTPLARAVERGELPSPEPDAAADAYYAALDLLEAEGFLQYELSNFARPGHRCRHNEIYWEAGPFIGLGPSAVSDDGTLRRRETPDLEKWLSDLESGNPPRGETERPTAGERRLEMAMLALRTREGLSESRFTKRWGMGVQEAFPALAGHLAAGRVEKVRTEVLGEVFWRVARGHQLVSDAILADLAG